jgi:hypothetical protein
MHVQSITGEAALVLPCRYVGYALMTQWEGQEAAKLQMIGFDMGGTSTDVSRFAGTYEHVFESTTAGTLFAQCSLAGYSLEAALCCGWLAAPQDLMGVWGVSGRGDHSGAAAGHQHRRCWRRLPPVLPHRGVPGELQTTARSIMHPPIRSVAQCSHA